MMDPNPFDQFDGHPAGGVVISGAPKPGAQYEGPQAAARLGETQASQAHTLAETRRMNAQAPTDAALAQANLTRAQAEATITAQKADSAKAEAAVGAMAPNSGLHGEAYLQKYVPPALQETVRAYARGDLGSRSGGLSTSMLPIIQHALNYDPTASGTNFPARVKMQSDLAGNQPNSIGGGLRSFEQSIFHGVDLLHKGAALNNYGPGFLNNIGNQAHILGERLSSDPALSSYNEAVRNYAPETQKGVTGSAGGQGERTDRESGFAATLPQAARAAALQADIGMGGDRASAINDQYRRVMGKDITDALSPRGKAAYDELMAGGYDAKGNPLHPAPGWTPLSGGPGGSGNRFNSPVTGPTQSGPLGTIATGNTKEQRDPQREKAIDALIYSDASIDDINALDKRMGGTGAIDPKAVENARAAISNGYRGPITNTAIPAPTTPWNHVAASTLGTLMVGAGNAASAGTLGAVTGTREQIAASARNDPTASTIGNVIGGAVGAGATELGLGALTARSGIRGLAGTALANPVTADALYGAVSGGDSDPNGFSAGGALAGGAIGAAGGLAGRYVVGPLAAKLAQPAVSGVNKLRGIFGHPLLSVPPPPPALSSADAALYAGANKAGLANVTGQLSEASSLDVPMTLADTSPGLRALGGAAVRRSPAAAQVAEESLLPRARGQIDRFGAAVNRDLGPTANVPQLSADLTQQAQQAAAPLYDQAYGVSVPHTPELGAVLNTPFGQQALSRAKTIAANERRSPSELGFALDGDGNTVLNPQPSQQIADHLAARNALDDAQSDYRIAGTTPGMDMTAAANRVELARGKLRDAQSALNVAPDPSAPASVPAYTQQTLDYVKRGMDDVLEQQRNPITGKLNLDEAGRAQNQVKNQLLTENDKLNPAFAQARAAYAGPVQASDALALGQDAHSLTPDELGMQVGNQSPANLAQMQLGYRSQLLQNARDLRSATNPFDAASTIGTPSAVDRLNTMYPNNPGNANLGRQAEIERGLARTNNKILGNSDTAERTLADKAFGASSWKVPAAIDAGTMAMGGVPLASAARVLATGGVRDAFTLGLGKRAVGMADDLAPNLFNTDPNASLSLLNSLGSQNDAYRAYINNPTGVRRLSGMMFAGAAPATLSR